MIWNNIEILWNEDERGLAMWKYGMECAGRIWCLQGTGATAEMMRCRPSQHVGSCRSFGCWSSRSRWSKLSQEATYKSFRLASSPRDWKDLLLAVRLLFTLSRWKVGWWQFMVQVVLWAAENILSGGELTVERSGMTKLVNSQVFSREHWLSAHDLVTWGSQQLGFQILSDPVRLLARGTSLDISSSTSWIWRQRWTSVLPHSRWRWRTSPLQRLSPTTGCPCLSGQVVARDSGGSRLRRSRAPGLCQRKLEEQTGKTHLNTPWRIYLSVWRIATAHQ